MEKSKSKKLKVIIIAEVCAVVIIAGVVGGIIYHNKAKVKKAPTDVIVTDVVSEQLDVFPDDETTETIPEDTTSDLLTTLPSSSHKNSGKSNNSSSNNGTSNVNIKNGDEKIDANIEADPEIDTNNDGEVSKNEAISFIIRYCNDLKKLFEKLGLAGKNSGLLGYYYDFESNCFRTKSKSWQSHFGFGEIYDSGAAISFMYYDTARVKFKYNNRDWMVQLWKGQYGFLFMGAEIGLYVKNGGTVSKFLDLIKSEGYDCATDPNDQLVMSMKLTDTISGTDETLFDIKPGSYWWLTGFQFGKLKDFSNRDQLRVDATIEFKDADMCKAFVEALKTAEIVNQDTPSVVLKRGYFVEGETFTVSGNTVSFTW